MKLYELDWGLFPRRVTIYLAEKGITGVERVAFDALDSWPPPELARLSPAGTVPILETEDGTLIRSSIAILEYLEERYPTPDMLGGTPEARARTREMVSVIDEAANQFVIWGFQGSPIYAGRKKQSREAATLAADNYHARLRLLNTMIAESEGPFVAGPQVTIADCMAAATLQFAESFYGVLVPKAHTALTDWYTCFSSRPSASPPAYPAPLLALAHGLAEASPPTSNYILSP